MDINIYTTYEVSYSCKGSEIDTENSEPNNIMFKNFNYNGSRLMNGGALIDDIQSRLNDTYFNSLFINTSLATIVVEHFNYNTGETCTYKWIIEGVKQ